MGADAPIPPLVMNPAAPEGAPPRRFSCLFLRGNQPLYPQGRINLPTQRGPAEAAERPQKGVGSIANPVKII